MTHYPALLATWLIVAGCAKTLTVSAPAPSSAIPLRVHASGHRFVTLSLGDHPFEFIVDTGASFTVISPQTLATLGGLTASADASMAAGADGAGMMLSVIPLPTVRIGSRALTDVQAAVLGLDHITGPLQEPVSGVVGQNILSKCRVQLDLQYNTLTLSDPNRQPPLHDSWAIPFDFFDVAPIIRLYVSAPDGQRIPAVLDSGAGATILNRAAAASLGAVVDRSAQSSQATGATDTLLDLSRAHLPTLQLAELQLHPDEVYVSELGIFRQLGAGDGPAVILGIDVFDGRHLTLDYESQTLWIRKP